MPNSTAPRTTAAAVIAGMAAGIASAIITTLVVTNLTAAVILATTSINTPTGNVATLNATTTNATTANATTVSATTVTTTAFVLGSGTSVSLFRKATATFDPVALPSGSCTSSNITLTGAAADDPIIPIIPASWGSASGTIVMSAGTNLVSVGICNTGATSTIDLPSATVGAAVLH